MTAFKLVYVDFAKVFDMVCPRRLQLKLQAYGISGALLNWLTDFLRGRSFGIKVGSAFLNVFPIVSWVHQASVLGPFLFLVFFNDLPDSIRSACKLFPDDVKVYRPICEPVSDFSALQDDLDFLSQWSRAWQLGISHENYTLFHVFPP